MLSLAIKQDPAIEGINHQTGKAYTISQFADDTSIAIINNKTCMDNTFKLIEKFEKAAGLKINVEKTEILLLGNATEKDIPKRYRKNIKQEVKTLGLRIQTDNKQTTTTNYTECMEKMKTTLMIWSKRSMSLAGKISVIKSLVTSKLTYCMACLPSPQHPTGKK